MKEIKCPNDIGFENIFPDSDCEMRKFYGDCYHCWNSSIAKYKHDIHNDAIKKFSNALLKQDVIDKSVIKRLTEQLMIIPD